MTLDACLVIGKTLYPTKVKLSSKTHSKISLPNMDYTFAVLGARKDHYSMPYFGKP